MWPYHTSVLSSVASVQGSIRGVRDVLLACSVFLGTIYSSLPRAESAHCGLPAPTANRIRDIIHPNPGSPTGTSDYEKSLAMNVSAGDLLAYHQDLFSIHAICQIHLKACRSRPKDSVIKRQQRFGSTSFQALQWIQNPPDVMQLCILPLILE